MSKSVKKAALTRAANKIAASEGITLRGKVDMFPSFASYRIDDPEGVITMKQVRNVGRLVAKLLVETGFDEIEVGDGNPKYHDEGVVFNWFRQ